ncbi:proline--tRNA ligase [Pseudalkalibacillus hwajinpoensis]|uniref:proline--tRNA ligase n=1 Tax=Guptibacillus hwajinpoensis TaxID=208199 RepID=UPI001CD33FCF|nr:proline--tRNA ligase [Pseudalkalibacillus hwajinpoensis]MCA0990230.1 proline--tRNA ligase [Pseudalkalibacillus hwajinpoensis]
MKQSKYFNPTLRDNPADAEIKSHQLLVRAGFMRQNASGIYSYLPLGKKVLMKIEEVIRKELDGVGAQELLMPAIQPAELWQETGRWDVYGPELMRLKDRHGRPFALGATHEELITSLVRDELKSYKQLPVTLYQIQTKYRDERRPRFGLLRGREFIMKDAYSFHSSDEQLDDAYRMMHSAYSRIFTTLGLNFRPVVADSGAMGGKDTEEFMALSSVGEDTIAYSDSSDYAANIEMAEVHVTYQKPDEAEAPLTEGKGEASADRQIHATLLKVEEETVLVLVRGDHELNDIKVKNLYGTDLVEVINEEVDVKTFDGKIMADHAVRSIVNGSLTGKHAYQNVNPDRDLNIKRYEDLRFIQEGDPSPDGNGKIVFAEGIEIGQVFKLGTKYSETMGASYLDEGGKAKPMIMGCYGIGVSRTLAAIAEQNADDNGLRWPLAVTPFDVHLITINVKDDEQTALSDRLYDTLRDQSYDVLYDDRKERAGVKFKDADLIGLPIRVIVGKKANEEIVEVKRRDTGESMEVPVNDLNKTIQQLLTQMN